jgi:hypothetical protein
LSGPLALITSLKRVRVHSTICIALSRVCEASSLSSFFPDLSCPVVPRFFKRSERVHSGRPSVLALFSRLAGKQHEDRQGDEGFVATRFLPRLSHFFASRAFYREAWHTGAAVGMQSTATFHFSY